MVTANKLLNLKAICIYFGFVPTQIFIPNTTVTVYATELMATGSVEEQRACISKLVLNLEKIVAHLPSSVSCGTKDEPIATNFASHKFDISKGPYYSVNKAWE